MVPIEKQVTRINKNGEENARDLSFILQFMDSTRFMASLLIFLKGFIELNVNLDTKMWDVQN